MKAFIGILLLIFSCKILHAQIQVLVVRNNQTGEETFFRDGCNVKVQYEHTITLNGRLTLTDTVHVLPDCVIEVNSVKLNIIGITKIKEKNSVMEYSIGAKNSIDQITRIGNNRVLFLKNKTSGKEIEIPEGQKL